MNFDFTTYTGLQDAVEHFLNRPDLEDEIPGFIRLAEMDLARDPSIELRIKTTLALASKVVALPSDCREPLELYYDDTERQGEIEIVGSPGELADRRARLGLTSADRPRYAAMTESVTGTTTTLSLILAPEPNKTYTAQFEYVAKLVPLAITSPNALLVNHADLYLYGALLQAEPFLKNDSRAAVWQAKYDRALAQVGALTRRRKHSANTPIMRPRRVIGG